jgi:hypothetical protein
MEAGARPARVRRSARTVEQGSEELVGTRAIAEREHRRAGLRRDRVTMRRRILDEDVRAGARVERVAVDREPGLSRVHEVQLLVARDGILAVGSTTSAPASGAV